MDPKLCFRFLIKSKASRQFSSFELFGLIVASIASYDIAARDDLHIK